MFARVKFPSIKLRKFLRDMIGTVRREFAHLYVNSDLSDLIAMFLLLIVHVKGSPRGEISGSILLSNSSFLYFSNADSSLEEIDAKCGN